MALQHTRRLPGDRMDNFPGQSIAPKSITLDRQEWQRIQGHLHTPQHVIDARRQQEERVQLHEQSKQDIATWNNTIVGMRQAKLEARAKREEEAEARRVELDLQEARYQAEQRQKALDRAKQLQLQQKDQVRVLNGAILTSEVIREREREQARKERRKQVQQAREQQMYEAEVAALKQAEQAEEARAKHTRKAALKLAEDQMRQAQEKAQKRLTEEKERIKEADAVEADVSEHNKVLSEKQQQQQEAKLAARRALDQQRAEKEKMKGQQQQLEAEEAERLRLYAEARDRMAEARYRKEMEKIKTREQFKATAAYDPKDDLQRRQQAEEERLQQVQLASWTKEEREAHAKEQARRSMLDSIFDHRQTEVERKAQQRQQELAIERQLAEQYQKEADEAKEQERTRAQRRREESRRVQEEQQAMIQQRKQAQIQDRMASLDLDKTQTHGLDQEDDEFRALAQQKLQEARAHGCSNTVAIAKALQGPDKQRPAAKLTATQVQRAPGNPFPGRTSRRLGFNYG
eukprot:TRINITY_DN10407_c0_g1_i2.p1 TRINITY_DN10407_c0_g1~~TRINITY_DN10407_c0_g1_i2.p1  ORF type:complete len:518 (+),score=168.43 TRINITY_DN10407_c0_g1_i2:204-1757(+)